MKLFLAQGTETKLKLMKFKCLEKIVKLLHLSYLFILCIVANKYLVIQKLTSVHLGVEAMIKRNCIKMESFLVILNKKSCKSNVYLLSLPTKNKKFKVTSTLLMIINSNLPNYINSVLEETRKSLNSTLKRFEQDIL